MKINNIIPLILIFFLYGCGKVGPVTLAQDKLDKSIITYPCNKECMEKFEAEKLRQKSVKIKTD